MTYCVHMLTLWLPFAQYTGVVAVCFLGLDPDFDFLKDQQLSGPYHGMGRMGWVVAHKMHFLRVIFFRVSNAPEAAHLP